jgi:hypothetical protein
VARARPWASKFTHNSELFKYSGGSIIAQGMLYTQPSGVRSGLSREGPKSFGHRIRIHYGGQGQLQQDLVKLGKGLGELRLCHPLGQQYYTDFLAG